MGKCMRNRRSYLRLTFIYDFLLRGLQKREAFNLGDMLNALQTSF